MEASPSPRLKTRPLHLMQPSSAVLAPTHTCELRCSNSVSTCSFWRLKASRMGRSGLLFHPYMRSTWEQHAGAQGEGTASRRQELTAGVVSLVQLVAMLRHKMMSPNVTASLTTAPAPILFDAALAATVVRIPYIPCSPLPTLLSAMMKGVLRILSSPMDSIVCCSRPCIRSTISTAMSHRPEPR